MDKGDYMQLLAMARAHDQPARSSARGGGSRRPRTAGTVSGTGSRRAQRLDEKYGGGGCGWLNTFDRELPPPFGRCSAATIRKFNDNMLQERFGEIRKVKGAGKAGGVSYGVAPSFACAMMSTPLSWRNLRASIGPPIAAKWIGCMPSSVLASSSDGRASAAAAGDNG